MRSKPRTLLAAALLLLLSAPAACAETAGAAGEADTEVLLEAIRANRKALIAVNLKLTDEEAKGFWPAYDRYQKEMNAVQERLVKVVEDYTASFDDLSDEKAKRLVDDYLAVEVDRAQVRRANLPSIAATLPGRKVARFYQIENKMDAVVRYHLAAAIPVVGE
jgi:hypothetical protein